VFSTKIDAVALALVKAVCVDHRVENRWYRSSNRNKMMCFIAAQASIKLWETGTVRVEPHVAMNKKDLADFFFNTLNVAAGIPYEPANLLADSLVTASQHKVFPVGERVPRFRIDHYKESLGLEIYADDSHPYGIEINESWPPWTAALIHVNETQIRTTAELARQIGLHLDVMKGINVSVHNLADESNKLADVVERFNGILNNEHEPIGGGLAIIIDGRKARSEESPPDSLLPY